MPNDRVDAYPFDRATFLKWAKANYPHETDAVQALIASAIYNWFYGQNGMGG